MSNFEPLTNQPVASLASYPAKEHGGFRVAWLTGMMLQLAISGLVMAGGAYLIIDDLADTTDKFHGLAAMFGGFVVFVGLVAGLWNYASISLAKSSRRAGASMGAVVPSIGSLGAISLDGRYTGVILAGLLVWFGVSAGFVSQDS